jgi:NADPH2:quinone reductase
MKAWVRENYGGPEQLKLRDLPMPVPGPGDLLVRVRAIGINRAEMYFRSGAWGDVAPVSGIEAVGEVVHDPQGNLREGATVAAFMGGLGRTRSGAYAEYLTARSQNVVPIETTLLWAQFAAIPESYSTAWACLFQALCLRSSDTVVIRGATSALGLAAINLAVGAGAEVLAAARSEQQKDRLLGLGAKRVVLESANLSQEIRKIHPQGVNAVLDLLGNSTFLDSMKMPHRGGRVCVAGFLGGGEPVPVSFIRDVAPGVHLSFLVSILFGEAEYPMSAIPLQSIVKDVEAGRFDAAPARIIPFDELPEAHVLMESNAAKGKIVVTI